MADPNSVYELLTRGSDTLLPPEQRLWISVVLQAAIDAASSHAEIRRDVVLWLACEDFEEVCGMAGMSPVQISHEINAILASPDTSTAYRRAMTFRFAVRRYVEFNLGEADKNRDGDVEGSQQA